MIKRENSLPTGLFVSLYPRIMSPNPHHRVRTREPAYPVPSRRVHDVRHDAVRTRALSASRTMLGTRSQESGGYAGTSVGTSRTTYDRRQSRASRCIGLRGTVRESPGLASPRELGGAARPDSRTVRRGRSRRHSRRIPTHVLGSLWRFSDCHRGSGGPATPLLGDPVPQRQSENRLARRSAGRARQGSLRIAQPQAGEFSESRRAAARRAACPHPSGGQTAPRPSGSAGTEPPSAG